MSPIARLRQLRQLPRALLAVLLLTAAQTALVPCAMAYSQVETQAALVVAVEPAMHEHCSYCPPDAALAEVSANDCAFPHAPAMDVFAASAHHVDVLLGSPLLHAATYDVSSLRSVRIFAPLAHLIPPPARPLTLTHCVQLK